MSPLPTAAGRLVDALRPCVVAVVGDVMLDRYVIGSVRRLSPEAPVPVLEVASERALPGGAANVAAKAAGLGAEARLVGLVGTDAAAEELRAALEAVPGLEPELVADPTRPTTVKVRLLARGRHLLRTDRERRGRVPAAAREALAHAAAQAAGSADALVLEDYGKGVLSGPVLRAALGAARARGIPVVVDPAGRDFRRYAGATVLTPNLPEAEAAAGRPIAGARALADAGRLLVARARGAAVAITRGPRGIALFHPGPRGVGVAHLPALPLAARDVTGAGDAVAACLAIALASGLGLLDACVLANCAGGAVVRQLGVGTLDRDRLREAAAAADGRGARRKAGSPPADEIPAGTGAHRART